MSDTFEDEVGRKFEVLPRSLQIFVPEGEKIMLGSQEVVAIASHVFCSDCAFRLDNRCDAVACSSVIRPDSKPVIFVTEEIHLKLIMRGEA